MIAMPAQPSTIVLVDGGCAMCSRAMRFLERRLPRDADVELLALQSERGAACAARFRGLAQRDALVLIRGDRACQGGAAVAEALLLLPRWRLVGRALAAVPTRPREQVYDLVARNRHRLFRGPVACSLPVDSAPG